MKPLKIKNKKIKVGLKSLASLAFLLFSFTVFSQTVTSTVDSTNIKIGEQINFILNVEADTTAAVVLPSGQTFLPLEVIDEGVVDTTLQQAKYRYIKKYGLTQFDSGSYVIPRQKIIINNKEYFTDSVRVMVNNVVVDTTQQKMFDIKDLVSVQKSSLNNGMLILWVVLGLLVIGGLLYWFVLRKKPLTEDEKVALLPPFERALLELKKLENSKYLIQSEYKQYYSELTNIVRSYLEEEVHVSALESTTDQLIDKLEMLKETGNLDLEENTISQFKKVLQTADLVKFARSTPNTKVAEQDRDAIENIVVKTKEALPEPTEEELQQTQEYLEEQTRKKRKQKLMYAAIALGVILLGGAGAAIARYGFTEVKDTVLGHPTRSLLQNDWVASEYGYPPIFIETPEVLIRNESSLDNQAMAAIKEAQQFEYAHEDGLLYVSASAITYNDAEKEFDHSDSVAAIIQQFEDNGAKNIIKKQDDFLSKSKVLGVKTYGTANFKVPDADEYRKGHYAILNFGGKGFQQQIVVTWVDNDAYAQEIADRIINSIDVKTES
jgi:hypothetical protein